jgi:hypothetical protein
MLLNLDYLKADDVELHVIGLEESYTVRLR